MRFIANDGKIFDTMEECREYEEINKEVETGKNPSKEIAELWNNYISTYDSEGHEIKPRYSWENYKDYLNDIEDVLESAYFIKICCTREEWEKIDKYLGVKYNICNLPFYHSPDSLWRYDLSTLSWVNFVDEYEDFRALWAPIGIQIIASN